MSLSVTKLRACIVGCKRGLGVARRVREMAEYEVAGVCDLDRERVDAAAATLAVPAFTDFDAMLRAEKPDVVFIATNTQPRAALTIAAAEAGVPGIIAEKPMAMSLGEARAMIAACERAGAKLIVTHQRRMGSDLLEMRALIAEGALGEVEWVRASCAGDLLTDGTHAINSARFLLGDPPAQWVLGQVFRPAPGPDLPPDLAQFTGFRYGHPVEAGAVAAIHFATGVRAEILTGKAQPGRPYQDYEVFGTRGRLHRAGDQGALFLWDEQPGGWREVAVRPENRREDGMVEAWRAFARWLREGGDHPLSADKAILDHEVLMAIYESARLSARIALPLRQDAFPLQLMMDAGRA